jgi:hypothetical protein
MVFDEVDTFVMMEPEADATAPDERTDLVEGIGLALMDAGPSDALDISHPWTGFNSTGLGDDAAMAFL